MTVPAPAAPVETKVTVATLGAAVSSLVVWLLDAYAFAGEVPMPVSAFVVTVVTFISGYLAPHTYRS